VLPDAVTLHVRVAGEPSTLPAWSLARTLKLWDATLRPLYALGLEHDDQLAPSSLHS
jgi:hypothetical protein